MIVAKRLLSFFMLLLVASPAMAKVLDNQVIADLVKAGLGDQAVIAKIEASEANFDTSTAAIIVLSQSGVSSEVIASMITANRAVEVRSAQELSLDNPDPMVPHYPGVYLMADWLAEPLLQSIDATTSNQTRTGGFLGHVLTGGLVAMRFKTAIPNPAARIFTEQSRPKFYFYFDQSTSSLSGGARDGFWASGAVTSPAEFSLVKFDVKRDRREATVGSFDITGARSGVMEEDQIPFAYEIVMPGVYEAVPSIDLEPGEYGFLYSASTGGGGIGLSGAGSMTARIFDFSIRGGSE